jgi:hypothetical protein
MRRDAEAMPMRIRSSAKRGGSAQRADNAVYRSEKMLKDSADKISALIEQDRGR